MFPIYQSLYKHLPPFFPHPNQNLGGKSDLPPEMMANHPTSASASSQILVESSHHLFAAAAAAAMEQAAAASVANSKFDSQERSEESISPSPPVGGNSLNSVISREIDLNKVTGMTSSAKQPFLKFSVSAILSKAKAEISEASANQENANVDEEAVKSSDNDIEGKTKVQSVSRLYHSTVVNR